MTRFFSKYLEIKENSSGSKTLSKVKFKKDDTIYELIGDRIEGIVPSDNAVVQVGNSSFLLPSGSFEDYTAHSCNPNSYIRIAGSRVFLMALHEINVGDEVTWDYSTTSTEHPSTFSMQCCCHKFLCRKDISGFYNLTDQEKEKYIKMGIIHDYLLVK
jgi:plastocyanin